MFVSNGINFLNARNWGALIFSILAYIWVLGTTILRRLPYKVRATTLALIIYLFSWLSFPLYGLSGDGRVWLLFFVSFTTIMLGLRAGIFSLILSAGTFVSIAVLMLSKAIPLPSVETLANSGYLSGWVTTGISLLFASIIIVFSIGILIGGLNTSLRELNLTLESERELAEQLQVEHERLESRSQSLERRVGQIRTAAEVSRAFGNILDPQELLQEVVDLIKDRFDLYYVGIFLVDEYGRYAILTAGTGTAGQNMIAEEHRLSVGGSSMIGWTTANRRARIALDVGQEAIRFNNPHLPDTRSELALPIAAGQQVLGAISVQSVEPEAFDDDDITVLQGIADSLAVALENARLFQQYETSLKEIQSLNREYVDESWSNILMQDANAFSITKGTESLPIGEETEEINVPLTLRGDQVIGNITLEAGIGEWSAEETEFINAVGTQAALALESARMLDETQRRVERERRLNEMTAKFSRSLDFESLIKTVLEELSTLPEVVETSIHIAPADMSTRSKNTPQAIEENE